MRIAAGIYIKERITLSDVLSVVRYSEQAVKEPKRRDKLRAMKKVVRALTTRRWFINLRDLYYMPKILAACKMNNQARAELPEDIETSILKTASALGAKCNKLPFEIMTGMTPEEAEVYSLHLLVERYEQALSLLMAYHTPKEYSESINTKMREASGKLLNFGKALVSLKEPAMYTPKESFQLMGNVG